jgi:hypothetical protein
MAGQLQARKGDGRFVSGYEGERSEMLSWSAILTRCCSRGGPAEMLKASKPTQLADGVSISAARLMLEILAIYETFGEKSLCEPVTVLLANDLQGA